MDISAQLIGRIAGVIALLSVLPYIISIFRGYTKPSRSAYGIWLIIDTTTAASYIASGARTTIWISAVYALASALIFGLSLKYGMGGYNKFDLWCLGLAAIAIIMWVTTRNPAIALYASIIAGKIGYLPVIKKSYQYPATESLLSWAMTVAASVLNLFALTSFKPEISLLPISSAIVQSLVVMLLLRPRQKLRTGQARLA